jgi:tetratricopeptide (TPR) repeat protein
MSKLVHLLVFVALAACRREAPAETPGAPVEPPQALMDEAKRHEDRRDPAGLAFMTGAVDRLQARKQHHPAAEIARTQGRLAWHLSRYREAIAAFERSMTLARQAGDEVQAMKARRGIFTMLYELGDLRSARRVFEEAMRGSARVDDSSRARLEFDRGLLAEAEGQLELAQAAFEAVLRSPAVKPSSREAWLANVNRLTLALQRGDLDAARQVHGTIEELFARPEVNAVPGSRIASVRIVVDVMPSTSKWP